MSFDTAQSGTRISANFGNDKENPFLYALCEDDEARYKFPPRQDPEDWSDSEGDEETNWEI